MAKLKEMPVGVPSSPDGAPVAPEGTKSPPHGTPRVVDVAGDLPRVCAQLDRVPRGSKARRFKCRVVNYDNFRVSRYVLALDAESAKACHLRSTGVEAYIAGLKASGAADSELPAPQVVVTELDD